MAAKLQTFANFPDKPMLNIVDFYLALFRAGVHRGDALACQKCRRFRVYGTPQKDETMIWKCRDCGWSGPLPLILAVFLTPDRLIAGMKDAGFVVEDVIDEEVKP